ncbi:MAG: hypothetical protein Q9225_000684 [Loekoesia sp. 1 TL-2023]
MKGRGSRHSNSPTAFGSGELSLNSELPRERVTKGLVSARIEAYRKHAQQQGNVAPVYPQSYPQARFERVQTQGGWPSYNADLYLQEHPRTMSLASNLSWYNTNILQNGRHEHVARAESPASSSAFNSPRITNLLHLWESKGQTHRALYSPQLSYNASLRPSPALVERPLKGHQNSNRTDPTPEATEAPIPASFPLQHINSLVSRSSGSQADTTGRQSKISENCTSFDVFPAQARNSATTSYRDVVKDSDDSGSTVDPDYQSGISTLASTRSKEDLTSHAIARSVPLKVAIHGTGWQRNASHSPHDDLELKKHQPVKGMIRDSPSSDDRQKTSHRGRSKTRRGRHPESSVEQSGQRTKPLVRRMETSDGIYPRSLDASEARDTKGTSGVRCISTSPTSRCRSPDPRGWLLYASNIPKSAALPTHPQSELSRRSTSESSSSIPTTPSDLPVFQRQPLRGWQHAKKCNLPPQQNKAQGTVNQSMHTVSTSSSVYYSMDQAKPASGDSQEGSLTTRNAKASDRNRQDSATLESSGVLDAATQTDTLDRDAERTGWGWSGNESIAWHGERMTYDQVSRPVGLERRLRRPAVRKVQVIISLDGAADYVMDARLRRNAIQGRRV